VGPRQRQLLLLGYAILAIVGAFMGYRLIRPELGPARVEHDPLNGPPAALAGHPPSRLTGAPGAGPAASNATPPPPTPPSSTTTTAPSVGRFRAVGTVQSGEDGPKIAGALVEVFSWQDARELPVGRGQTDGAGRFVIELPTLDVMPPAALARMTLHLSIRAAGHRSWSSAGVMQDDLLGPPRDVGGDVVLALDPGHDVVGRVVDEEGRPVVGAQVTMLSEGPSDLNRARTDASGEFRYPVETDRAVYFLAELEGLGTGGLPPRPMTPDAEMVLPDLVLRRGAAVAGVVVDRIGRPVAGVPVHATSLSGTDGYEVERIKAPAGTMHGSAMTDAAGRFRVTGLFPGDVKLEVVEDSQDGRAAEAPAVRTGREDVRLVLAGHVVRVAVVDSAGAPVLGARWRVVVTGEVPPRSRHGMVDLGEDVLGFELVPEDARVVVSASLQWWTPAKAEAICAGPGTTDIVLRLAPAGAEKGRVRIELTGELASRVTEIEVELHDLDYSEITHRGAPGDVFEVPPGHYRVEVLPKKRETTIEETDFVRLATELTVLPGEETRMRLRPRLGGGVRFALAWPEGTESGELQGIVATSLDGETAPTDLMWMQRSESGWGTHGSVAHGSRGDFSLWVGLPIHLASGGLPAGRWMFEVRVAGYEPVRVVAAIEQGKVADVRVPLAPKPK